MLVAVLNQVHLLLKLSVKFLQNSKYKKKKTCYINDYNVIDSKKKL